MDLRLERNFAVITGGSSGIGLAVARGLAEEGVDVAIIGRGEERLERAVGEIERGTGSSVTGIRADVTEPDEIERAVSRVREVTNRVDILINNAGTGSNEDIMDAPDEKWQYFWDLHVMAAVRLSRLLVPVMKESPGEGVILNTSSICATQPLHYEPIYNTTKAALTMLSKCLAEELAGENIRVNAVNPGLVLTPDWKNTARELTEGTDRTPDDYLREIAEDKTPLGRFAEPEEVADLYVFLCSPRASYCLGSTYYIDGGWLNTVK